MQRKSQKKPDILEPLPEKDSPGYFRALVNNCVRAYEKSSNDGLALDLCKVADKKLRAMILNDEEYKVETKNIYARQRIEEMEEVEYLASVAANGGMDEDEEDDDDDHYAPRDGERKPKKLTGVDKDMINMQFKAAQMKRELRAELSKAEGDNERDAINFMFIPITREEFEELATVEINQGSNDADFDALMGAKEEVPSGSLQMKGSTKLQDEDYFDVLPDGEIVER